MLKTQGLQTLEHIRAVLEGAQPLGFEVPSQEAAYDFVTEQLRRIDYSGLVKADKRERESFPIHR